MPPLSERIRNYLEELYKWEEAGKPTRSIDRIKELYEVCKSCPNYFDTFGIGGRCNLCGCLVNTGMTLNKLSLATTRCPEEPPKWTEELEQEKNVVVEKTDTTKIEKPQIQQNDEGAANIEVLNKTKCCG
jgi:hypothetical protein